MFPLLMFSIALTVTPATDTSNWVLAVSTPLGQGSITSGGRQIQIG